MCMPDIIKSLYKYLFAIDNIDSWHKIIGTFGRNFPTLQIVLCALTMPSLRNPSGYNLRLYYA